MIPLHDNENTLLALVRTTFDAHSAVLFLPDDSGNYTVALSSSDEEPFVQKVSITPGKGLVGWILRQRQPLIVNTLDMRHTFLGYYDVDEEQNISAFMGCYLLDKGALCVDSVKPREFTEADLLLLHRFARHITREVHSAGLASDAEKIRRYFNNLEGLADLGTSNLGWKAYLARFLRILAEGAEFDYTAFATMAEGANTCTLEGESTPLLIAQGGEAPTFQLNNGGLVSWVFRNDVPVYAEGNENSPSTPLFGRIPNLPQFQTVICLPIQLNKVTCGVLCLACREQCELPPNLRTFTKMAAMHLSQYLERLFLRHRVKTLLPNARVHNDGAMVYDPDTAPSTSLNEEE